MHTQPPTFMARGTLVPIPILQFDIYLTMNIVASKGCGQKQRQAFVWKGSYFRILGSA